MCGITGIWSFAASDVPLEAMRRFNDALAHRGPDGAGIEQFPDHRLYFGHRRLAILDLSEHGRQPMSYADGRFWLTFNGEIYNFIELRRELQALGHGFRSETDSEVVLAAYAQWGEDCQFKFNGMWAFAIWDAHKRELFLSRDRFGVKPLHYSLENGRFVFASELKAFLALPWCGGQFDEELLRETLDNINGYENSPDSLLPGVRRLLGGHSLRLTPDGVLTQRRWWDTLDHVAQAPSGFAAQTENFRDMFFDACRLRLRSDVAVGTSLSGGLDSSAVAGTIATIAKQGGGEHLSSDWQRAFVACFPGTNLDEERYAKVVIDRFGLTPHYYVVDEAEALQHLEDVVFSYESIYWVPLVGPWSIYREMRRSGVVVSLDGHGADELLGGYHFFIERELEALLGRQFRYGRYRDLKKTLAGLTGGSAADLKTGMMGDLKMLARRTLGDTPLWPLARRLMDLAASLGRSKPASGAVHAAIQPVGPLLRPHDAPHRLYTEANDERYQDMSVLQRSLYLWFHHSVLPTLLRNYDRSSMAHGVEVRMPFMDWRLVTSAFGMPDESKIGHGYTKRVLREAMAGLLPESIRLRTNKIGFTSPLDQWMRGSLRDWVMDSVTSQSFQESSVWHGPNVRAAAEQALAGQRSFNVIWPILNAHALQRGFVRAAV